MAELATRAGGENAEKMASSAQSRMLTIQEGSPVPLRGVAASGIGHAHRFAFDVASAEKGNLHGASDLADGLAGPVRAGGERADRWGRPGRAGGALTARTG
jgi:hypothetical protein